jgi:uncharacterized protein (TIGR03067 family)
MLVVVIPYAHPGGLPMLPALLLFLVAADSPKPEPDKNELKKVQGTWLVTEQVHGGKKLPGKELAKLVVEISGKKITTREAGELREETTVILLDPKAKPAAVDLKVTQGPDIDKVVKAIYKIEGDALTVCVAEPDKDRPTAFAGKEGTGHTLMVFKKVKKTEK